MGGISPRASGGGAFPYYFAWLGVGTAPDSLGPFNGNWGTIPAAYQTGWTSEYSATGVLQLGLNSDLASLLFDWDFFAIGSDNTSGTEQLTVNPSPGEIVAGYDYALVVYLNGVLFSSAVDLIFIGTA
jgi:hypothetical protein